MRTVILKFTTADEIKSANAGAAVLGVTSEKLGAANFVPMQGDPYTYVVQLEEALAQTIKESRGEQLKAEIYPNSEAETSIG